MVLLVEDTNLLLMFVHMHKQTQFLQCKSVLSRILAGFGKFWLSCTEYLHFLSFFLQAYIVRCTKIDKYDVCTHKRTPTHTKFSWFVPANVGHDRVEHLVPWRRDYSVAYTLKKKLKNDSLV